MGKKVDFKFDIDDRVNTSLGDDGIVESLAFDEAGNKYYVSTANNSRWVKEKDLTGDDK